MKTYLEMLESIKNYKLVEADDPEERYEMSDDETIWKKNLLKILSNKSGKYGKYRHPAYARRLKNFMLHIIPLDEDPQFTAAVSFENKVVYMSEAFIRTKEMDEDEKLLMYRQLEFLLRHEISHVILCHQIRMMNELEKTGDVPWTSASYSHSIWDLWNIIEDFEISNRKYTTEDKELAVNLKVAGRTIHGLVTEEHREDWKELSVEEMYHELVNEIDSINKALLYKRFHEGDASALDSTTLGRIGQHDRDSLSQDMITSEVVDAQDMYGDLVSASAIRRDMPTFIAKSKKFKNQPDLIKNIITELYNNYVDASKDTIRNAMNDIARSSIIKPVELDGPTLHSPEEKWWAMQVFKNMLGMIKSPTTTTIHVKKDTSASDEYVNTYNAIVAEIDDADKYPTYDLYSLLDKLSA